MRLTQAGWALLLINCGVGWTQPYVISTVAGGAPPQTPVAGPKASVGAVTGIATDAAGNVYFSSALACVFKLDQSGTLSRYAGTCRPGYSGDGGPAESAQIFAPAGLAASRQVRSYAIRLAWR